MSTIVGFSRGQLSLVPARAVEHRSRYQSGGSSHGSGLGLSAPHRITADPIAVDLPAVAGAVSEMCLEHLPDVHARGHAQRVQDDVHRRAVRGEGHVLHRQYARDDALVAVASGELVANADLAVLRNIDAHELVDAGGQFARFGIIAVEQLDVDDFSRSRRGGP